MSTFFGFGQLSTLRDRDCLLRFVPRSLWDILDLLHNVISLDNFTKYDVLPVEPAAPMLAMSPRPYNVIAYFVMAVVMKNWDPFVSLPEFAMLRIPLLLCFNLKFSSLNFSP